MSKADALKEGIKILQEMSEKARDNIYAPAELINNDIRGLTAIIEILCEEVIRMIEEDE